jgi:20S proteasome alpha/beta subunit
LTKVAAAMSNDAQAANPYIGQRLARLRKMTVAAGYVCDEGVVLCADTQETIPGYTKTHTDKVLVAQCAGMNLVFAGAGNNAIQIDEAIHEISSRVTASIPENGAALNSVLRNTLEMLFPKAHYPRPNGQEVDLLMAVQTDKEVDLYRISDCNIAPVKMHACIGSGVILGAQLLERHYDRKVQLSEAAIISSYVLYHVKKWVDGCGGNTDIALVPKGSAKTIFLPSEDVDKFERYAKAYDDAVKGLLLAAPRTPKNRSLFKQYIQTAENELYSARSMFQEFEETMRELCEQMGMDYDEMMRMSEIASEEFFAKKGTKQSTAHSSEDQR